MTGQISENRQIILNCSVIGSYNKKDVQKFQFNNNPSHSCTKTTKVPNDSTNTPYVRLLDDGTTCQLTIPKATNANYTKHRCRVRIKHPTQLCFFRSEITIPYKEVFTTTRFGEFSATISSEESFTTTHSKAARITTPDETLLDENDPSNYITKTEVFSIGGTILVSLIVTVTVVIVVTAVNYQFKRQPQMQVQENNAEHLLNVIQPRGTYIHTHSIILLCPPHPPP